MARVSIPSIAECDLERAYWWRKYSVPPVSRYRAPTIRVLSRRYKFTVCTFSVPNHQSKSRRRESTVAASRRARGIHHLSNCSWATEARLRSHIPRRTLWQGLQECVGSAVQSRQTKAGHHWKRQKCRHASTIRSFCQESGQSRTCTVKKVQCQRNIYIIMSTKKKQQKTKSIEYNANSTGWEGLLY